MQIRIIENRLDGFVWHLHGFQPSSRSCFDDKTVSLDEVPSPISTLFATMCTLLKILLRAYLQKTVSVVHADVLAMQEGQKEAV